VDESDTRLGEPLVQITGGAGSPRVFTALASLAQVRKEVAGKAGHLLLS
jgi:hypothetical protein